MAVAPIAAEQKTRNPAAIKKAVAELTAAFGNRIVTSQAVREQHGNTVTWIVNQPPDAVVYPQSTEEVQQIVRICGTNGVAIIPFGVGTSLEGHVNAPVGGISIDFRDMSRILAVHAEDLDCIIEPGITRCATAVFSFRLIRVPMRHSAEWQRRAAPEQMPSAMAP